MDDKDINNLERRCPRLGSKISFRYCLISGEDDNPCWKIFDCWWEYFDVAAYLKANLPAEMFEQLARQAATTQAKNKLASIVEIAEQAKNKKNE